MKTNYDKFEEIEKLHTKALNITQAASGLVERLEDAMLEIDVDQLTEKGKGTFRCFLIILNRTKNINREAIQNLQSLTDDIKEFKT